jgi:hypothetical protein
MSPTQRTLKQLRDLGYTAAVTERWNQYAKVRIDLFGVIDIVALFPGVGILGVQATSRSNHAARRVKALAEPALRTWLACGGRFEVWSWGKAGARGEAKRWGVKREEITLDDLPAEPVVSADSDDDFGRSIEAAIRKEPPCPR